MLTIMVYLHGVQLCNSASITCSVVGCKATVTFTNRSHASAAHLAALHAPHVLPLLLDAGAPMSARDLNKWTIMHFAAWGGQTTAIQELAARGAR
jgi:ankyrin repeat protein